MEALATGIKIGSNDQRDISDRSSNHSHFHERSGSKKALIKTRRDVTTRQRSTCTYARTRVARTSGVLVLVNTRAAFQLHMYSRHYRRSLARKLGAGRRVLAPPSPRPQLPPGEKNSRARAAGAGRAALARRGVPIPTVTFELGDQAIKVDFKRDQAINGRFRRSKILIPVQTLPQAVRK